MRRDLRSVNEFLFSLLIVASLVTGIYSCLTEAQDNAIQARKSRKSLDSASAPASGAHPMNDPVPSLLFELKTQPIEKHPEIFVRAEKHYRSASSKEIAVRLATLLAFAPREQISVPQHTFARYAFVHDKTLPLQMRVKLARLAGEGLFSQGQFGQAKVVFTQALDLEGLTEVDEEYFRYQLAWCQMNEGHPELAFEGLNDWLLRCQVCYLRKSFALDLGRALAEGTRPDLAPTGIKQADTLAFAEGFAAGWERSFRLATPMGGACASLARLPMNRPDLWPEEAVKDRLERCAVEFNQQKRRSKKGSKHHEFHQEKIFLVYEKLSHKGSREVLRQAEWAEDLQDPIGACRLRLAAISADSLGPANKEAAGKSNQAQPRKSQDGTSPFGGSADFPMSLVSYAKLTLRSCLNQDPNLADQHGNLGLLLRSWVGHPRFLAASEEERTRLVQLLIVELYQREGEQGRPDRDLKQGQHAQLWRSLFSQDLSWVVTLMPSGEFWLSLLLANDHGRELRLLAYDEVARALRNEPIRTDVVGTKDLATAKPEANSILGSGSLSQLDSNSKVQWLQVLIRATLQAQLPLPGQGGFPLDGLLALRAIQGQASGSVQPASQSFATAIESFVEHIPLASGTQISSPVELRLGCATCQKSTADTKPFDSKGIGINLKADLMTISASHKWSQEDFRGKKTSAEATSSSLRWSEQTLDDWMAVASEQIKKHQNHTWSEFSLAQLNKQILSRQILRVSGEIRKDFKPVSQMLNRWQRHL